MSVASSRVYVQGGPVDVHLEGGTVTEAAGLSGTIVIQRSPA